MGAPVKQFSLRSNFEFSIWTILLTFLFFIISASVVWGPIVDSFAGLSLLSIPIVHLIIFLILSFLLANILVANFDWDYIKDRQLSHKLILVIFLFSLLVIIYGVISSLVYWFFFNIASVVDYGFIISKLITPILLIACLISLLINFKYNWILPLLYSVVILFDFTSVSYQHVQFNGAFLSLIQNIARSFVVPAILDILEVVLTLAIIIYLYLGLKNCLIAWDKDRLFFIIILGLNIILCISLTIVTGASILAGIISLVIFLTILFSFLHLTGSRGSVGRIKHKRKR